MTANHCVTDVHLPLLEFLLCWICVYNSVVADRSSFGKGIFLVLLLFCLTGCNYTLYSLYDFHYLPYNQTDYFCKFPSLSSKAISPTCAALSKHFESSLHRRASSLPFFFLLFYTVFNSLFIFYFLFIYPDKHWAGIIIEGCSLSFLIIMIIIKKKL